MHSKSRMPFSHNFNQMDRAAEDRIESESDQSLYLDRVDVRQIR